MPRLTPEQQIKRAEQAMAKAEETIRRARSKLRSDDRKADTRRKIILGAALLDAAMKHEGPSEFVARIVRNLDRPADREAFEDFDLPKPGGL